ncbi:MAG: hypothetical protein GX875_04145, partial [Propionibacterium sp.]|nr:hypothetical protein [Propionibacterium sp.]
TGAVIIYQADDESPRREVGVQGDTWWLSQEQMVALFRTSKQNVSLHIRNVVEGGELDQTATVKDFLTVRTEGT